MNELDVANAVRAEVGEPSADRLAEGRARLTAGIAEPRPARAAQVRRPVFGRRTAIAGGLALAAAAAGAVIVQSDGGGERPRSEAADFLNRAALVSAKSPALRLPPGKFLYAEQVLKIGAPNGPFRTDRLQSWSPRPDMNRRGRDKSFVHQRGKVPPGFLHGDPALYVGLPFSPQKTLDALPTDPARLLRFATHPGVGADGHTTKANPMEVKGFLSAWLQQPNLPPGVRSAAYRALAGLPGVTLDRDVTDAAGRHGVGVDLGAVRSPESRLTLILDRRTYRLLGTRDSSVVHSTDNATGKRYDERAVVVTAILRTAVVPTVGKAP